jgi:hypothetical protein
MRTGTIRPGRRLRWWHTAISPDLRRKAGEPKPHSSADAAELWNAGDGQKLLQTLKPGEVTEFRIRMRPTAHRFLEGHRIRLDVTSSDFPNYDRNHNTAVDQNADAALVTARQTIHHGTSFASRLILPVMLGNNVLAFDQQGKSLADWGKPGGGQGEFNQPGGIAIGPDDFVYVVDQANHRIQRFTPEGKFLAGWGEYGNQPGQFGGNGTKGSWLTGPHFCAFDREGSLYTTEAANGRIPRTHRYCS